MKMIKVESIYEGRCFEHHSKKCGAFIVHQVWERETNKTKIALIEDLQTNKLSTISLRTIYRRHKERKELNGNETFKCKKCKGQGTNKRQTEYCRYCEGFGEILLEASPYPTDKNFIVSRPKKRFSFHWFDFI